MANKRPGFYTAVVFVLLTASDLAKADDWPQWRGPQRDGVWRESGLREDLSGEPSVRWRVPVALGYAGPAVADGKVYLFEYETREGDVENQSNGRTELSGLERVRCLDEKSGEQLWKHEYERAYKISYPGGPRCTPTVDGDRVYTLGAEGDLKCLQTSDGSVVWSKLFSEDYGAKTPIWGHSAHPLVDGDTLYCLVGGEGSIVVAFDKMTGEEKWRSQSAKEPGYCPPTMMNVAGERQLVAFYPGAICGLDPASGAQRWTVPIEPSYGMSISQPLMAENRIFAAGYNASVCFSLATSDGEPEILWSGKPKMSISGANASPIYDGETIYGVDANDSALVALDPASGKRYWQTKVPTLGEEQRGRHGTVFVIRQGETDRYWLFSETGDLILAKLSPEGYEELGRQHLLEMTSEAFGRAVLWSHPAFANRAVYARNDKEIVCVDVSAQ